MPGVETVTAWAIASWIVVGASTAYTLLKGKPKTKSMADAFDGGLRANTRSTQEPLKIVYGKMRVGGNDVYMTTTGHTVFAHIKGMITGWEEIEEGTFVADWEQKTK